MAKKFFRIKKKDFYEQLDLAQEREAAHKGGINNNLYIYYRDEQDGLLRKVFWKNNTWGMVSKSISRGMRSQDVKKVTVGNEYFDWELTVFSRI